jgi:hypothetical protein
MVDETEGVRRLLVGVINSTLSENEQTRLDELVGNYGADNVWDTQGVQRDFEIIGFMAPFVVARRKADNVKGSLTFCHDPRFYFDFREA